MPLQDMTNKYAYTKYIVDPNDASAYDTIQAAVNDANVAGGGTVLIQDVAITEDVTLYDNIAIRGTGASSAVIGTFIPPLAGTVYFEDIILQDTQFIISSAGAGTTNFQFINVTFNITVAGFILDIQNWTAGVAEFLFCDDDSIGTSAVARCEACGLEILGSNLGTSGGVILNSGGIVALSSGIANQIESRGGIELDNTEILGSIEQTNEGIIADNCSIIGTITTAGNADLTFTNIGVYSGANEAIIHSSTGTANLNHVTIDSTEAVTGVLSGTGTYNIGHIDFINGSLLNPTATFVYERTTDRDTPFIVGAFGTYTTIQAAINACLDSPGSGYIKILDGTYTENLTLRAEIFLIGSGKNCTIRGVHTPPTSGQLYFENIRFTNAGNIINSGVAGTTSIKFYNCQFEIDVATTGVLIALPLWTTAALIELINCNDYSAGQMQVFNTGALLLIEGSYLGGTTQTSTGTGLIYADDSQIGNNFIFTGTNFDFDKVTMLGDISVNNSNFTIRNSTIQGTITTATAGNSTIINSELGTGDAGTVITHAAGTMYLHDNMIYTTSATPIAGAGTVSLGTNTFTNTVGVNTRKPNKAVAINSTDGSCLRTIRNNALGTETVYVDYAVGVGGQCEITPSGPGIYMRKSLNGSEVEIELENTSNTAGSDGRVDIRVAGAAAGDPLFSWDISGVGGYCMGIDNSDSDILEICRGGPPIIGANIGWQMTSGLQITKPAQAAFYATNNAARVNVTGDGTAYTLALNTTIYNRSTVYNTGTYTATIPVTGICMFSCRCKISGVTAAHTTATLTLVTSARPYIICDVNPGAIANAAGEVQLSGNASVPMTATNTAYMVLTVSGSGAADITVVDGDATGAPVSFEGILLI